MMVPTQVSWSHWTDRLVAVLAGAGVVVAFALALDKPRALSRSRPGLVGTSTHSARPSWRTAGLRYSTVVVAALSVGAGR